MNKGSIDPAVLASVENLELKARMLVEGLFIGLHGSPYYGQSPEFASHRQYYPGDEISRIDWKVYGRSDKHFIKRYEMESDMPVMVVLDTSASMAFNSGDGLSKLGYAVHFAAALAHLAVTQNDRAGLALFDEGVRTFMPARGGKRHLFQVIDQLSRVGPSGETSIIDVCHEVAGRLKQRGLVLILSDFMDPAYRQLSRCLSHFRFSGYDVAAFHILDPAEIEFPFQQTMNFADMETGEEVVIEPRGFQARYQEQMNRFREAVRKQCFDAHFDYTLIDTARPIEKALQQYLAQRARITSR